MRGVSCNHRRIFMLEFELIRSMFSSRTPESEEAILSFARHLATYPVHPSNTHIYQKIIEYNLPEAIDAILKDRDPVTFFATVEPTKELVSFAFGALTAFAYNQFYESGVCICLGVLEHTYRNPRYGIDVHMPSVSDLYHTAKYLKTENETIESLVLDILRSISNLADKKHISIPAKNIVDAYYDETKTLEAVIPHTILVEK